MSFLERVGARVRWELAMRYGVLTDADMIRAAVARRKAEGQRVLLNLGCGTRFHGDWVNIDFRGDGKRVASWDLRTPIPLPAESCDAIYASHVIEHFTRDQAKRLVTECRRLLRAGGCLRLATPDLEGIVRAYLAALDDARRGVAGADARHEWMTIELVDQLVRHRSGGEMVRFWAQEHVPAEDFVAARVGAEYLNARAFYRGRQVARADASSARAVGKFRLGGEPHLWMYDDHSLCRLLQACGFQKAERRDARQSAIEGFREFCLDADADGVIHKPDSFFVEGLAV